MGKAEWIAAGRRHLLRGYIICACAVAIGIDCAANGLWGLAWIMAAALGVMLYGIGHIRGMISFAERRK